MNGTPIQVLSVASEIYPLVKTGGLADVVGALPAALGDEGVAVRSLVPGYPAVLAGLMDGGPVHAWPDLFGAPARLLAGTAAGLALLVLDAPQLYDRPGDPYGGPDHRDWPDNGRRFAALARVGADIARGLLDNYAPDVVHAHDWQAGLLPAYLHYDRQATGRTGAASVMTVHNLAFQGQFPPESLAELGLPPEAWSIDGVEYYGAVGFLKAGLRFADRITTVSPGYAAEIRTPAGGMGMDGLLRGRRDVLAGILNGIDTRIWNPAADASIPSRYADDDPGPRVTNARALRARLGLADAPGTMLFGAITRLTAQKGSDLLLAALPAILEQGAQLAVLGSGDAGLQEAFRAAAALHPGRVACVLGYDEDLAHLMQAGVDALLVPSRFEPCGLTQLCALRYGAVPVVARVGGLADTVDAEVGIAFEPVTGDALAAAIGRAAALHRRPAAWRKMRANGMARDVSWAGPARQYAALYRGLLAARA